MNIIVAPGIYSNPGDERNDKKYESPFHELMDIINNCEFLRADKAKYKFKSELLDFRFNIKSRLKLTDTEFKLFDFAHSCDDEALSIKCKNLFTACILYGHYVPYMFVHHNETKFVFKDDSYVEYITNNGTGDWLYFNNVKLNFGQIPSEQIPLLHPPETKNTLDSFNKVKKNLNEISDEELRFLLDMTSGSNFHQAYAEKKRREELKLAEWRKENPGVPDGATKLEVGNNYYG